MKVDSKGLQTEESYLYTTKCGNIYQNEEPNNIATLLNVSKGLME